VSPRLVAPCSQKFCRNSQVDLLQDYDGFTVFKKALNYLHQVLQVHKLSASQYTTLIPDWVWDYGSLLPVWMYPDRRV